MVILSTDHRDLFLPLIEGIHESPPWGAFLRNLVARMQARRAIMLITLANAAPDQAPSIIHVAAPRAADEALLDFRQIEALRLHPFGALRPGRIYGLNEMLDYDDRAQLARQRAALSAMRIRDALWLRISASGAADAWLLLVREREDFGGSAIAVLGSVAVHLASALRTLAALIDLRLQTALANSALGRLGIGQLAFDADGRVMAVDPTAQASLILIPDPAGGPGLRLHLRPDAARRFDAACAELAGDPQALPQVICIDDARGVDLLLRGSDLALASPSARPAVIGVVREPLRESARSGIRALASLHGLSVNEAALAHALSMGERLADAGARLHLTEETTRNYSKRIYTKTRAHGQVDLVRLILMGLTPLV